MPGTANDDALTCPLCFHEIAWADAPAAHVPSNVRAHIHETFPIWRCPACNSLHAAEDVDLDHYYRQYPYQNHKEDLLRELILRRQTRRLRQAGMRREDAVLDFGCGSGLLVNHLKRRGYRDVMGYDAYTPPFDDPAVLGRGYDVVHAQDVIEHVADPRASFAEMVGLLRPGGLLCIGTPNADAVHLDDVLPTIHTLHQPYHRHILSRPALDTLAAEHGLEPVASYRAAHDTPWPFINLRFFRHYAELNDNTLDLGFEDYRITPRLFTPRSLYFALLGSLLPPVSEMLVIFRKKSPGRRA